MTIPFSPTDMNRRIETGRRELDSTLADILQGELSRIRNRCLDAHDGLETTVDSYLPEARRNILDSLLADEFLEKVVAPDSFWEHQPVLLRHVIYSIARPISVSYPKPQLRVTTTGAVVFAAAGAWLGILFVTPLIRLTLGFPTEVGILIGAPLGAAVAEGILLWIARSPWFITALQVITGTLGVADIGMALVSRFTSTGTILKRILGQRTELGSFGLMKRLLMYAMAILLLQLARPERKLSRENVFVATDATLTAWMNSVFDLLLLATALPQICSPQPAAEDDGQRELVQALAVLAENEPSPEPDLANAARQVINQFKVAGFEQWRSSTGGGDGLIYQTELDEKFESIGMVEPGTPVRVLKLPWHKNGRIVIRGVLTRARSETRTSM